MSADIAQLSLSKKVINELGYLYPVILTLKKFIDELIN